MLENRSYFTINGEQATRIEGFLYAVTESGRIWRFWNEESGREQEPKIWLKNDKNYIRKPRFEELLIPKYGYIIAEFHGKRKLRSDLESWHTGLQRFVMNIKKVPLHFLVACYFIPNPNKYEFVEHIDRIKTNNHFSNLRWVAEDPIKLGYYMDRNKGSFADSLGIN